MIPFPTICLLLITLTYASPFTFPMMTNANITDLYDYNGFILISFKNSYDFLCSSCHHINLNETEILSILEIKTIPSLKHLSNGKVINFDDKFNVENIQKFIENPKALSHSYLPTEYSIFTKLQLDLFYATSIWIDELVRKLDGVLDMFKMTVYRSDSQEL